MSPWTRSRDRPRSQRSCPWTSAETSVLGCSSNPTVIWSPFGCARSSGTSIEPHQAPVTSVHGSSVTEPRVSGCDGSSASLAAVVSGTAGVRDRDDGDVLLVDHLAAARGHERCQRDDREHPHSEDGTCGRWWLGSRHDCEGHGVKRGRQGGRAERSRQGRPGTRRALAHGARASRARVRRGAGRRVGRRRVERTRSRSRPVSATSRLHSSRLRARVRSRSRSARSTTRCRQSAMPAATT